MEPVRRSSRGATAQSAQKKRRVSESSQGPTSSTKRLKASVTAETLEEQAAHHRPWTRSLPEPKEDITPIVNSRSRARKTPAKSTSKETPKTELKAARQSEDASKSEKVAPRKRRQTVAAVGTSSRANTTRNSLSKTRANKEECERVALPLASSPADKAIPSPRRPSEPPAAASSTPPHSSQTSSAQSAQVPPPRTPIPPRSVTATSIFSRVQKSPVPRAVIVVCLFVWVIYTAYVLLHSALGATTRVLDISLRRVRSLSSPSEVEEWEWGVPQEHIRIVRHAEEVLTQQQEAMDHWLRRHRGVMEPALEEVERGLNHLHAQVLELSEGGNGRQSTPPDSSDVTLLENVVHAEQLQRAMESMVEDLQSLISDIERTYALNSLEVPLSLSNATFLPTCSSSDPAYENCLFRRAEALVSWVVNMSNPNNSGEEIEERMQDVSVVLTGAEGLSVECEQRAIQIEKETSLLRIGNVVHEGEGSEQQRADEKEVAQRLMEEADPILERVVHESAHKMLHGISKDTTEDIRTTAGVVLGQVLDNIWNRELQTIEKVLTENDNSKHGQRESNSYDATDKRYTEVTAGEVETALSEILLDNNRRDTSLGTVMSVHEVTSMMRAHANRFRGTASSDVSDTLDDQAGSRMRQSADVIFDRTWGVDYAVSPRGGKVFPPKLRAADGSVLTSTPFVASSSAGMVSQVLHSTGLDSRAADPQSVVSHVIPPEPGHCYAFPGDNGNITVTLHSPVYVRRLGIYHLPLTDLFPGSESAAPKEFLVVGWTEQPTVHGLLPGMRRAVIAGTPYFLGNFVYRGDSDPLQTFAVPNAEALPPLSAISFIVASNHGNSNFTCVYRIQVFGELAS